MSVDYSPNLKIWWRHWGVVLILAGLAGFVIWGLVNLGSWLKNRQTRRAVEFAQEQFDKAYKNDKYGGTTPEETFKLFVFALENGDIDLASKYFVLNKQEQWKKILAAYKNQAFLAKFANELKLLSINQDMFEFYPSGVWKISNL